MTTGLMKLVGGVVVAFFAVWIADISEGLVELTRGAAMDAARAGFLDGNAGVRGGDGVGAGDEWFLDDG